MASTYSSLKIELIGTGDQAGTWGTTTNTNLGTALEEAITGSADVTFASANVELTLTNTNASQIARNLRLNLTGTSGGARNLYIPAIEKQYIVKNGLADTVTVTNGTIGGGATGTGVAVLAGDSVIVFNNGTNVERANSAVGTVTAVSVASANGLAGTSSGGATPALTLSTTVTGIVKGNGTALSAAVSGTDYAPATSGTSILSGSGIGGFSNVTIGTGISFAGGTLSATGSGGDVVGPASATDNAIARFDGTTGKLIQNSAVTVADTSGDITGGKYNKVTITAPATGATLTIADGKTATVNNSITFAGTDTTTMTFPATSQSIAGLAVSSQIFTTAQTFRAASAVRSEAASTQDAVVIAGRAGGTSSYAVTLTPSTLSASRTATLPDGGGNYTVGYQNVPAVGTKTAAYTLATADVGKYVQVGASGSIEIPDSVFAEGDVVSVFNNTSGAITITCTITTAYIAGTDADKATVSLATRGLATILFISGTVCVISGNVS